MNQQQWINTAQVLAAFNILFFVLMIAEKLWFKYGKSNRISKNSGQRITKTS